MNRPSLHPAFSALMRRAGAPAPGAAAEEVLDIRNIQGNILAGFNKDHQAFLFLKITDAAKAKAWLKFITPSIASADEVLSFNRLFKAMRARRGDEPGGLAATWLNIAFSHDGINALAPGEADKFADEAFQLGLPTRSSSLGDPTDAASPGNPNNWVVGKTGAVPDVLLIVASDDARLLQDVVDRLLASFQKIPGAVDAGSGLELMYDQRGNTLPDDLRGHEHFGFKDGISQPAVRGRISSAPDDFFTPRFVDPTDPRAASFSAPGDALVYPGQFVFGYELQNRSGDGGVPFDPDTFPAWAKNGSYLVFRRLRQDVAAFRAAMSQKAAELAAKPDFAGMTGDLLAAKLVGRWPSGAPVARSPNSDNTVLGTDDFANNHFAFQNASTPLPLKNAPPHEPDAFPQAPADSPGLLCPHAGHIRKVNPRDLPTDTGGTSDTLARRILRRGIPYGDPLPDGADPASPVSSLDRGLLFVCYQTSIVDQFEFLINHWVNTTGAPEQGGFDIVIGQNGASVQRERTAELPISASQSQSLTFQPEWIVPTGGGYFFAPSIDALANVLSKP